MEFDKFRHIASEKGHVPLSPLTKFNGTCRNVGGLVYSAKLPYCGC